MFRRVVDEEISLLLLQEKHAEALFELINPNKEYLSRWMPWALNAESADTPRKFLKAAMKGFSEGREIAYGIEFKNETGGCYYFQLY